MEENYNETYLDGLIFRAKESWDGVDVESYMQNLRDDYVDKEVAEKLSKDVSSYIIEQLKDAVKLKCRDLMVGDYVANHHGFPMQITNVGDDYAYATWEDNVGDPWEFDDKDGDGPEPIEITDDIMRKNDWEEHSYPLPYNLQEYYYVKDEIGNHLVWNGEVLSIWLDWEKDKEEGAYANIDIPIRYVHQFQQALRISGMTDMANNFKI